MTTALLLTPLGISGASADAPDQTQKAEELGDYHSCVISVKEFAEARTNALTLEKLFLKYIGACSRDLSAIDDLFVKEIRNDLWAVDIERFTVKTAKEASVLSLQGECHSSLCRFDIGFSRPGDMDKFLLHYGTSILEVSLSHTVAEFAVPRDDGLRMYIYSTEMPPKFLDLFLERMTR